MMNTMSNIGWMWSWHIDWLFFSTLFVGVILFLLWAYKSLNSNTLAQWAIWTIIIGLVGILLSGSMHTSRWFGMHNFNSKVNWQEMGMHLHTDDHSDLSSSEDWEEHLLDEMRRYKSK
jgi:hypothetical protein